MLRLTLIVVAVALLFTQLQCVAACARQSCGSPAPPCHRHHNSQQERGCPNQLLVAAKHTVTPMFSLLGTTAAISVALPADAAITAPHAAAVSPPRLTALSYLVLRI